MKHVSKVVALAILFSINVVAVQQKDVKPPLAAKNEKVRVIAGARYKAGWLHRVFFGSLWRNLWTTPMEVEVLDLDTFAGGLTVIRRTGGFQTKGLRLRGEDGRQYKIRSINKDPKLAIPADLRESIVYDISQDLISSANPLAVVVVDPFLEALGILHAETRVIMMPDDERLGEFREEFAGMLGTIEVHPTGGAEGQPGFAGADKVISTYKLFDRLEADHDERVDATGFLTARLIDMYLGDWDRHMDQWRWARIKESGKKIWEPIPRDRDWAFARYNGLVPWISTLAIPQIEGFSDNYPKIADLVWSGRYVDRRLLVSLDKPTWDSVTTAVLERLTDTLLENAVRLLPPEMYAKEGEAMEKTLKSRRSKLREASEDYYILISKYVDVRGSNKQEYAEIKRLDDHRLEVALYKRSKKTGAKKGKPFYRRIFDDKHTREVRLYLLGGDDIAVVEGKVNSSIQLRVIGGDGNDALIDNSKVKGYFLSVVPFIPHAETKTRFYDSDRRTRFRAGPSTAVNRHRVKPPANDVEKYEPPVRDWSHDWKPGTWFGADSDDGFFIGGGPVLYKFGFRADPYVYRMSLRGGYATTTSKFRGDYTGEFFKLVKGARVVLHARASELDIDNFFGLGNETIRDEKKLLENKDFYKLRQIKLLFNPTIKFPAFSRVKFTLGSSVKYVNTKVEENTFLELDNPYGVGKISFLGFHGGFQIDTRNHPLVAKRGILFDVKGSYFPPVFNNRNSFGKARAEARAFISGRVPLRTTLALRVAGEKIWGDHPFYESSFIGGSRTIRGFHRERFAGDASVIGNAELRVTLGRFLVLLPGAVGISFLGDIGRVFESGLESEKWHSAGGGGIWFAVVRSEFTFSISVARSSERTAIQAIGGFMF
ncbi:MAG: BamA/TamA family outer membrane protein [Bacteroidota bacterium]